MCSKRSGVIALVRTDYAEIESRERMKSINTAKEMIEMLEASRQYRNMVEALSTAKQLMLETMRMK